MATYAEKLKDPRWQRKRLEVLQRDEFRCCICGDDKTTLNIHHTWYKRNADPWDYQTESLKTLCENCHTAEHESRPGLESDLILMLKQCGANYMDLDLLCSAIAKHGLKVIALAQELCCEPV